MQNLQPLGTFSDVRALGGRCGRNPSAMTPLSLSVHEDLGVRVFWTKGQAEAALYAIYSGDAGDF